MTIIVFSSHASVIVARGRKKWIIGMSCCCRWCRMPVSGTRVLQVGANGQLTVLFGAVISSSKSLSIRERKSSAEPWYEAGRWPTLTPSKPLPGRLLSTELARDGDCGSSWKISLLDNDFVLRGELSSFWFSVRFSTDVDLPEPMMRVRNLFVGDRKLILISGLCFFSFFPYTLWRSNLDRSDSLSWRRSNASMSESKTWSASRLRPRKKRMRQTGQRSVRERQQTQMRWPLAHW